MMSFKTLSVAVVLLALICSTNSYAETLTVDAGGPVAPGATGVPVKININEGGNTAGASFTVTYDATKLDYKGVSSVFFATFAAQGINPPTVTIGTPPNEKEYPQGLVDNPLSGAVMLAAARTTNGTAGDQTLFTLTFDVKNGATGDALIDITRSTITNASAGYLTPTELDMLVGVSGSTYPIVPITAITTDTITIGELDLDGDDIADNWEIIHFGNLTIATATSDFDRDGYTDKQEYLNGGSYNPKVINVPGGLGYVNILADSLVINFPQYGLYTYNSSSSLTRINTVSATLTATADIDSDGVDEIVSYFPGYGIYVWDNGVWGGRISSAVPEAMIKFGNKLAIDFGSQYGLYTYNTSEKFIRINVVDPTIIAETDVDSDGVMELAAYFTGYGIYIFDNGIWGPKLTPWVPQAIVKFGNKLAIDFGSQYGLYTFNTTEKFIRINSVDPTIITEVDVDSDGLMELATCFAEYGIYIWNNDGTWSPKLSAAVPQAMIKFGNRLAIDFGSQYGLYTYNAGEKFIRINSVDPTIITEADIDADGVMELAAYFAGYGIYIMDNGKWGFRITPTAPDKISCGNIVK